MCPELGQCPGPYGFSTAAEPFDEAVEEWAATLADSTVAIAA